MKLYAHQQRSLDFLAPISECFDMSEPGTGKTLVHLVNFARRHKASRKPGVVFATKSLLEAAWANDAAKFTPELRVSVAWAENRAEAFRPGYNLYITNHDAIKWFFEQDAQFRKRFGHMIVDESTAYKHATSQRGKAAAKVSAAFETVDLLSGTPTPNGPLDLWNQAFILDQGKRLGRSYFQYRASICESVQTGPQPNMVSWRPKAHAEAAIAARMADCSIRHVLEECVDMPQRLPPRQIPFRLSSKHRAIYEKMAKDLIAKINERDILALNGAVLRTKLLQIASGSVYDNDHNAEVIDDARYQMVLDLVEERRNTIVVFQWHHQREQIIKAAQARGVSFVVIDGSTSSKARNEIVDAYQKGFYRFLLGHPQSMAHGLTLTRGEATIWASPTSNLEWWEQANRRIYRIGQEKRTETLVLTAENTQDEIEYERCLNKDTDARSLYSTLMSYHA